MAELNVPTFVKGEPGFAAKLNELGAAVLQLAAELGATQKELAELKAASAAKPATTRKASTKA